VDKELITSNGNFYIQDTAIEDFNTSGGTVTLGTGDMVLHHTNAGAEAYDFTFNGVISCDEFWFRKATDGATKGCIITFLATLAPILAAGKRVILENRMPTLDFIIDMNGFDIQVGVV
jgi:hypothetical protein